ncbi:MAG: hypothetical protein IPH51_12715 [Rubrivivax sp.]|nr:hypothetical protein [Rubrivivax sp.]
MYAVDRRDRTHAGRRSARLFWRLHAPLLRRSTTAAALTVFIDVMKELPPTLVLRTFASGRPWPWWRSTSRDGRLDETAHARHWPRVAVGAGASDSAIAHCAAGPNLDQGIQRAWSEPSFGPG